MNAQEPFSLSDGEVVSVEIFRGGDFQTKGGEENPGSGAGPVPDAPRQGGAGPDPSLSKNHICDEVVKAIVGGRAYRTGYVVELEVQAMVKEYGEGRIMFGTLTFADNVTDEVEAQRRLHSFQKALMDDVERAIVVMERQESGRIHYHMICAMRFGFDPRAFPFDEVKRRYYRNVDPRIREFWLKTREGADSRGFGRVEFLPIKKNGQALARYASKYIIKGLSACVAGKWHAKTKLVRFWGYIKKSGTKVVSNARRVSCQFAWVTEGGRVFRKAAKRIAAELGYKTVGSFGTMCKDVFGVSWGWVMMSLLGGGFGVESLGMRDRLGGILARLGPYESDDEPRGGLVARTCAWASHKASGTLEALQESFDEGALAVQRIVKSYELDDWCHRFKERNLWRAERFS